MSWKRTAVVLMCLVTVTLPVRASFDIPTPTVPGNIAVPAGFTPFLLGHAEGTQNYSCVPSGKGVAWTLYGPQATLFDDAAGQMMTHFLSPNPDEGGALRATWQDSHDTSRVWAMAVDSSTDPAFVAPGAIAWLLLRVVGSELGPGFGDKLTGTMFIHRVNTAGGIAPATGCTLKGDLGKKALVPYTTDYIFYR